MKRYIICFLASLISIVGYAQKTVVVHQGTSTQEFQLTERDSITHTNDDYVNIHYNSTNVGFPVSSIDSISVINSSSEFDYLYITNVIDWGIIKASHIGYKLLSIEQEKELAENENNVVTPVIHSETPQIMLLLNSDGEIVMMSKTVFSENGQTNYIDAHSTAIALVAMHPIFPFVHGDDYETLVQIITSSQYFAPLETEIQKKVEQGKSPLVDNDEVLMALGTLLEELTSEKEEEENIESLEILRENAPRRDVRRINIADITDIGPFDMELLGDVLYIRTHFLTPYYEGVVGTPSGNVRLDIPAGPDVGIVNLLSSWLMPPAGEYGDVEFNFRGRPDGEYLFTFDRTTAKAKRDFVMRLIADILDLLGLPLSRVQTTELVEEIIKQVDQSGLAIDSWLYGGGAEGNVDPYKVIEILTSATLNFLSSDRGVAFLGRIGIKGAAVAFIKKVSVVLTVYQAIRGGTNSIARCITRMGSPEKITYRLCHYDNSTSTCQKVKLEIMSGDNQEGHKGERLNESLWVRVRCITDDGIEIAPEETELYQVKFEVVSGGGKLEYGTYTYDETYNKKYSYAWAGAANNIWILGRESTEQKVRACVIDPATKEEISDPVYFTAKALDSDKITFRLDWDRTLTNTDIDLHVQCPKGHHIFYASMSCPCGGQLDRDDTRGPGPEHIEFSNADPGDYIVYVHHFASESKANIGYTLRTSLNDGEKNYRNVGSVPHLTYSPKYRLRIPENSSGSRRHVEITEIEDNDYPIELPKKSK